MTFTIYREYGAKPLVEDSCLSFKQNRPWNLRLATESGLVFVGAILEAAAQEMRKSSKTKTTINKLLLISIHC